jgi:hypothetical protein
MEKFKLFNQIWLKFSPSGGTKIIDPPPHNGISVGGLIYSEK